MFMLMLRWWWCYWFLSSLPGDGEVIKGFWQTASIHARARVVRAIRDQVLRLPITTDKKKYPPSLFPLSFRGGRNRTNQPHLMKAVHYSPISPPSRLIFLLNVLLDSKFSITKLTRLCEECFTKNNKTVPHSTFVNINFYK